MASGSSNSFSWWWPQKGSSVSFQGIRSPIESNIKCFVCKSGNTLNSHKYFIDRLKEQIPLQEVLTENACDFILVFCPIVSRAGTDIDAAVKKLQNISETKPAVLVVLHHTFDRECVVPDSSRVVTRKNMIAVDCLFHEDQGLLQCSKNDESLSTTTKYIKSQVKVLHKNVRKQGEGVKSDLDLRIRAKSNEEKDALLEDTNMKLVKMTNEAEESKNIQHERDQQLNQKYAHIQKAQELVELMEKRLVAWQEEIREQLKGFKNLLEINEKILSEKQAKLVKINENFQNATEQIKEKNKTLEEMDTQLKEVKGELEKTSTNLKENERQLKQKERQLENVVKVLETSKNKLAEKESLLTERERQLMERYKQLQEKDRLLIENTQTLQMKNKTLEEKDTQLKEVKSELEKTNTDLKENERQLKQKERQLENVVKEMETSKNNLAEKESLLTEREKQLMERDKQIQEKDRLLAAQTLQMKEETLEQKGTQFKQEKEQEEEGVGELPGPKCHLVLDSKSQENKDQQVEDIIDRQIENKNAELKNSENLTQEKGAPSKDTKTEIENMAKEPQERNRAAHEGDEQLKQVKDTQEAHIQVEDTEKNNVEKDEDLNKENEHQKGQDTQHKEKERFANEQLVTNIKSLSEAVLTENNETLKNDTEDRAQLDNTQKPQVKNETVEEQNTQLSGVKDELEKEVNMSSQEEEQEKKEQEQPGDVLARGTDN
ncbi:girdin isoform X2 [Pangasianodon hypophthalmus]|uniref:girdin isoform X2 n=1 Tax=Pangasianodon hypophthalmus TaxID=310915 RepID=UPI0023077E74|nr:girdin isoform X2 [Pangasianodon hypophthalmus]